MPRKNIWTLRTGRTNSSLSLSRALTEDFATFWMKLRKLLVRTKSLRLARKTYQFKKWRTWRHSTSRCSKCFSCSTYPIWAKMLSNSCMIIGQAAWIVSSNKWENLPLSWSSTIMRCFSVSRNCKLLRNSVKMWLKVSATLKTKSISANYPISTPISQSFPRCRFWRWLCLLSKRKCSMTISNWVEF